MEQFAKPGDFCPNEACPNYGKLQNGQQQNLAKFGKTRKGVQRYRCHTCRKTFTETCGTIFYGKRTPEHEILETLAFLAEGTRISSVSRVKGHKEDTIVQGLRQAAQHAAQLEAVLMAEFKVKRGQLDALWAYVRNKGEKKVSRDGCERAVLALDPAGYRQSAARGARHCQRRDPGQQRRVSPLATAGASGRSSANYFRWVGRDR